MYRGAAGCLIRWRRVFLEALLSQRAIKRAARRDFAQGRLEDGAGALCLAVAVGAGAGGAETKAYSAAFSGLRIAPHARHTATPGLSFSAHKGHSICARVVKPGLL